MVIEAAGTLTSGVAFKLEVDFHVDLEHGPQLHHQFQPEGGGHLEVGGGLSEDCDVTYKTTDSDPGWAFFAPPRHSLPHQMAWLRGRIRDWMQEAAGTPQNWQIPMRLPMPVTGWGGRHL